MALNNVLPILLLAALLLSSCSQAVVLHPHVPHHINNADIKHLQPADHSQLWYKEKVVASVGKILHATISYNWSYPAVVLDHSMHTTETCTPTTMNITFHSQHAYDYAVEAWNTRSQMIFLSSRKSCTKHYETQLRAMFLSTHVVYDHSGKSVFAAGEFKKMEEVATHGDAKWGTIVDNPNHFEELRARHYASQAAEQADNLRARSNPDPARKISSTTSCSYTPIPTPKSSLNCGKVGKLTNPHPLPNIGNVPAHNLTTCMNQCLSNMKCISFGYNSTAATCQLLAVSLDSQGLVVVAGGNTYYNRKCFTPRCTTMAMSSASISSSASSSQITSTLSSSAAGSCNTADLCYQAFSKHPKTLSSACGALSAQTSAPSGFKPYCPQYATQITSVCSCFSKGPITTVTTTIGGSTSATTTSTVIPTSSSSSSRVTSSSSVSSISSSSSIGSSSSPSISSSSILTSIMTSSNTANPTGNPYTSVTIVSGAMYAPTSVATTSCDPPAATISGLPAISYCDGDFDNSLDANRGYFNLDTASNISQILAIVAPGMANDPDDYSYNLDYDTDTNSTYTKRDLHMLLHKRWGFSLKSVFHAVVNKVESGVKKVVNKVETVVKTAVQAAGQVVKTIIKDTLGHVFSPSISLPLKASYALPQQIMSPWGKQFLLYQYIPIKALEGTAEGNRQGAAEKINLQELSEGIIPDENAFNAGSQILKSIIKREGHEMEKEYSLQIDLFCVDCGFKINFETTGHISFSILQGIIDGGVAISGGMEAVLQLGLVGNYSYKVELLHKRLATIGVPDLSIPNELAVGPFLTIDVGAFIEFEVEGKLLAGVLMTMANSYAYADFKDKSKNFQSGWKPTFTQVFQAYAEVGVTVGFDVPIGLAFGIDIANGKKDYDVALVDTPTIQAKASINVEWDFVAVENMTTGVTTYHSTPIGNIWGGGECPGIAWEIDFVDELAVNIPKVYNLVLWQTTIPITKGCITLWHSPTPTPTPSSSTSTYSAIITPTSSSTSSSSSTTSSSSSPTRTIPVGATYVASDLTSIFTEYPNFDFPGNDMNWGPCTPGNDQFSYGYQTYTCQNINDCQNICAQIVDNYGNDACAGISYTPNGNGVDPTPYCYLKSAMPPSVAVTQSYVVNSAVLFDLSAPSIWTGSDGKSKFYEYYNNDLWFSTEVDPTFGPCCPDTSRCNGFTAFGTQYQCSNFYDCQNICASINTQTGNSTCVGVSFTPQGNPPYCYIKTQSIAQPKSWDFRVVSGRYLVQNSKSNYPVNGSSYLASNGQSVFYNLANADFAGDDYQKSTCMPGSNFTTSYGSWRCENFYDCQNVCGNVNIAAGTAICLAISYTPNGKSGTPNPTCYLKNGVPSWIKETFVVNSAQLLTVL